MKSEMISALSKIKNKVSRGLHICVGLDSDLKKIPPHLAADKNPILEFNKIVIENSYKDAAAYKINFAFYEKYGAAGLDIISNTLELIPGDIFTIADAKRGDIGNTSSMYAESIFEHFNFDAVTLHPYMGYDSLSPFLEYKDKMNFILALTSNNGSDDFEKLQLADGTYLYQNVIQKVKQWNRYKNCGIVFGATNSEELKSNIDLIADLPVLLPGVGTQGGTLEDIVKIFSKEINQNYIVNISRALIYSDSTKDFGTTINETLKRYNLSVQSLK